MIDSIIKLQNYWLTFSVVSFFNANQMTLSDKFKHPSSDSFCNWEQYFSPPDLPGLPELPELPGLPTGLEEAQGGSKEIDLATELDSFVDDTCSCENWSMSDHGDWPSKGLDLHIKALIPHRNLIPLSVTREWSRLSSRICVRCSDMRKLWRRENVGTK